MTQKELTSSKTAFIKYHSHVELFFTTEVEIIKKSYRILYNMKANPWDYDEQEIFDFENKIITDHYEFDAEFKYQFRSSLIVQLYSYLESELRKFCLAHYKENKKEYSINDIKGNNDIDKIKKYLFNSANINLAVDNSLWEFVNNFRKLRNKLVHSEGLISIKDGDYKSLMGFSKDRFNMSKYNFDDSETFFISLNKSEFVEESISQIFEFLNRILNYSYYYR